MSGSDICKEALAAWVASNPQAMKSPEYVANYWTDGKAAKHWSRVAKKDNKTGPSVRVFELKNAEQKVIDPALVYDVPEQYAMVEENNGTVVAITFLSSDDLYKYAKTVGIKKINHPTIGCSTEVK
jgi:hypothetical protein